MEWLRWIITVAALAGALYLGRDYGRTEMLAQMGEQAIAEREAANAEVREQLEAGKEIPADIFGVYTINRVKITG